MSGEHVRRQFPCSAGLSVIYGFPLFYAGPNGVAEHQGNSYNAGTAARAMLLFNAGEEGEDGRRKLSGWLFPCLKPSHELIRTTAHITRRREFCRCLRCVQTVPQIQSHWRAPQRKVVQFSPLRRCLASLPRTVPLVRQQHKCRLRCPNSLPLRYHTTYTSKLAPLLFGSIYY